MKTVFPYRTIYITSYSSLSCVMQYRCDRRKQSNLTYDKILGQRVGFWVTLKIYYLTFVFFVVVVFYGAVLQKKNKKNKKTQKQY